ncbi:MAG: hypothetical protein METHP_01169 [Methanoregula sp. SKADARSKE-2]|nr:MAG: hypothetical protein METHP_01169 [Methanoregula sp. SKADARSKE-2]
MYPVLAFSGHISVFCREHPLKNPLFFEGCELKPVKAEGREQHFGMHPENGCDPGMSRMTTTLFETGGWVGGDQPSGRVTLIPNGKVITQQVHNYTKDHSFIWDELTIPISYDSDWKQAREIILEIIRREAAENTKQAETEIDRLGEKYYFPGKNLEPSVYITPTDNGITFSIRYVTPVMDRRINRNRMYSLILAWFQEISGITIS